MAVRHGLEGHTRLDGCGVPSRLKAFSELAYFWAGQRPDARPRQPAARGPTAIASSLPAKIRSIFCPARQRAAQRSDLSDPLTRELALRDRLTTTMLLVSTFSCSFSIIAWVAYVTEQVTNPFLPQAPPIWRQFIGKSST